MANEEAVTLPAYRPQLAMLAEVAPEGDAWIHEIKLDGYRLGCSIAEGHVRLQSRRSHDWTATFPGIASAMRRLGVRSALLDGEAVVLLPSGVSSFQALQNAISAKQAQYEVIYFAFDLLHLDGHDVGKLPTLERKTLLRQLISANPDKLLRYSEHFVGGGPEVFAQACKLGTEGIVSKRLNEPHRPGRSRGWLKIKCSSGQEFVVGGFTDPEGSRVGFGALLLGYYNAEGHLVFAGKVGTGKGLTNALLARLRSELDKLQRKTSAFIPVPTAWVGKRAHWVEPKLVVDIRFAEWTTDGHLRHPSLHGFRADKNPRDVVREEPRGS